MTQEVDGIYLSGYWDSDSMGVKVCGLTELAGFGYNTVPEPYDKFLENIAKKTGWNGKTQGNFLFAVTDRQIRELTWAKFLQYMMNHPNTKVIHSYTNNAHEPYNKVLICIHHMFPEQVKVGDLTNNVKDYL